MFSWQIQFSKVLVEWKAGICTDECVFKSVSSKSLFSQTAVIFAAGPVISQVPTMRKLTIAANSRPFPYCLDINKANHEYNKTH